MKQLVCLVFLDRKISFQRMELSWKSLVLKSSDSNDALIKLDDNISISIKTE